MTPDVEWREPPNPQVPGARRGKQIESIPTGIPDLTLVRYENRPNYILRIYNQETKKNVYRALNTADPKTALRTFHETYKEYLLNPTRGKEVKETITDMVDIWTEHIIARRKRGEIAEKTKVSKISSIKLGILPFLMDKKLLRITDINPRKAFKDYVEWRRPQGYKLSSIQVEVKHLNEMMGFLHKKGLIQDPTTDVEIPRQTYEAKAAEDRISAFTDQQLDEVWNELTSRIAKAKTSEERMKWFQVSSFCELMHDAGTRTDELYNVTFGDCSIKTPKHGTAYRENRVHIRKSKTGERVTLFISPVIGNLMERYKEEGIQIHPHTSLWVNPSSGKPWSIQYFSRQFRLLMDDLGFDKTYRLYSFRHSHITQAIERKVSLTLLAKNLGTSEGVVRNVYDHVLMELQTSELFKDERPDEEDTFQSLVG